MVKVKLVLICCKTCNIYELVDFKHHSRSLAGESPAMFQGLKISYNQAVAL